MTKIIKKPRILGVILARGGSKGVPKKNMRPVLGIPLIAYTVCEAKRSKYISRLIVSSDSDEIRDIAVQYGAEAPFKRPEHLSIDTASSHETFKHAVQWAEDDEGQKYDYLVEMLCTNPFKTAEDIDSCLKKLIETGADSVIGVAKLEDHHPIRIKKIVDDKIVDFCFKEPYGSRRQDLKPDAYIRNGAIYSCRRDRIDIRVGSENSRPYVMPAERSVNIDTMNDFVLAEVMLKKYTRSYIRPLDKIKGGRKGAKDEKLSSPKSKKEKKILITSIYFGDYKNSPIEVMKKKKMNYKIYDPINQPTEEQLAKIIGDYGVLVVGTTPVTKRVIDAAPDLRLIVRMGIGYDNVDVKYARKKGIRVAYTPGFASQSVAELAISSILTLLRKNDIVNQKIKKGVWKRHLGEGLSGLNIGVVGVGSIGKSLIRSLSGFNVNFYGNDIKRSLSFGLEHNMKWVSLKSLFKKCDIITLHVPLTKKTRNMIGPKELNLMRSSSYLVNMSRGGVVDEKALYRVLKNKRIAGAAMDGFSEEPYKGELRKLDNCLLTAHMGASTVGCKRASEMSALEEILRYFKGETSINPVP